MIFLAEKNALSMIICVIAASVLAKPLDNAQIVRDVFFVYTHLNMAKPAHAIWREPNTVLAVLSWKFLAFPFASRA